MRVRRERRRQHARVRPCGRAACRQQIGALEAEDVPEQAALARGAVPLADAVRRQGVQHGRWHVREHGREQREQQRGLQRVGAARGRRWRW